MSNISNKMDYEEKITAEKDDIEVPDWIKETSLRKTFPKNQKYMPNMGYNEPIIIYDSFEPDFTLDDSIDPMVPIVVDCQRVLLPYATSGPTTEELRKNPSVLALQEAVRNGAVLEVKYIRPSDKIVLPD